MAEALVGREVITLDRPGTRGNWVVFEAGRIVEVGSGDPPGGLQMHVTEGVILPGFFDAHLHLVGTGVYSAGLDLRKCESIQQLLDATTEYLRRNDLKWVIGGNFDPGRRPGGPMPHSRDLDQVAGERVLLVSRTDGHSCSVSSAGYQALVEDKTPGVELDQDGRPTGVLREEANYEARGRFFANLPDAELTAAYKAAAELALRRGVTSVHEMGSGDPREVRVLLELIEELPIRVRPYFASMDIGMVVSAGLDCIGGDLFLDGSIGSHTAALASPYEDAKGTGTLYRSDEDLRNLYIEATRAGIQVGVHAIGDAAIEQALRCLEDAFETLGPEGALGARRSLHRIEHFECVDEGQIKRAAKLGVVASVQPAFDAAWGGGDRLYAERLGERASSMNPFSLMVKEGMLVAGGSDSTVTPVDPLGGVASAMAHSQPVYGLPVDQALRMFTSWAAQAGREGGERGSIEPGKAADFCVLEKDPYLCDAAEIARLLVMETWVGGRRMFEFDAQ